MASSIGMRLGKKATDLVKFIADRAKEAEVPYLITGASALLIREVIERHTTDVDVNIAPRKSIELQDAIRPLLDGSKEEKVLVDGKTEEAKRRQTKFRFFKALKEDGFPDSNMKADVTENDCALMTSAYTDIEGVKVATVPLMVILKICATSRINRTSHLNKLIRDMQDLTLSIAYLIERGEVVPSELQTLFAMETPPFEWRQFWDAVGLAREAEVGLPDLEEADLEKRLHRVGIKKTRD